LNSWTSGIILVMKPLFVREITSEEREALTKGLRSSQAFTVKRCQILLASARGLNATQIAETVGCSTQNVRMVLRAFAARGLEAISMQSRRPKSAAKLLDLDKCEQLRAILHQSPRQFGKDRSTWTLGLAAEVCFERGLTEQTVTIETIRDAIHRLGMGWKRAKDWITSPDPAYLRKKSGATGS
jgi:transposase